MNSGAYYNLTPCIGAFYDFSDATTVKAGNEDPGWVSGTAFLKSMCLVYKFDPPCMGFAELSAEAVDTGASFFWGFEVCS